MTEEMKGQGDVKKVRSDAGTVDEQSLEVTRREFMRRAATVSGLAGFLLLGPDALLDAILTSMRGSEKTRELASRVERRANVLGRRAEAAEIEGTSYCGGYSMYCLKDNKYECPDDDFDCGAGGDPDVSPKGFRCQAGGVAYSSWRFSGDFCLNGQHACGEGDAASKADFTCGVKFSCDGEMPGNQPAFNCGSYLYDPDTNNNEFACDPDSGSLYKFGCNGPAFHCYANFTCADEATGGDKVGCSDTDFRCFVSFDQDECYDHYNYGCDTTGYDGVC